MPNVVQFPHSVGRHAAEVVRLKSIFRAKPASCRVFVMYLTDSMFSPGQSG
jgi:hypothetical protein